MNARLSAVVILIALTTSGFGRSITQESLNIVNHMMVESVVAGQLVDIAVAGVGNAMALSPSQSRLIVSVIQDGVPQYASVRSVGMIAMPPSGPIDISKLDRSSLTMRQLVTFVIPPTVHEGDATVVVTHEGRSSNQLTFKVTSKPQTPRLLLRAAAMTSIEGAIDLKDLSSNRTVKLPKNIGDVGGFSFERGTQAEFGISPLVDTEASGNGIMVTFRQGVSSREVAGRIVYHDAVEKIRDGAMAFAPSRVELRVKVPEDLALGEATMEVRLRANGQLSEPATATVTITDPKLVDADPGNIAPRLTSLSAAQIGAGQSVQIEIANRRSLDPDPSSAIVILEQGSYQERLGPEVNSAALGVGLKTPREAPSLLFVRLDTEMRGKVNLRVLNPARGEKNGLSAPLSLEILNNVLPPEILAIDEATDQDLFPLRKMREMAHEAGREFKDYDPASRYISIHARRLDYNPNYVRVAFEQGGQAFNLKREDFSLQMADLFVVRIPDRIRPGDATIRIQNRGRGQLSEPVSRTIQIKR